MVRSRLTWLCVGVHPRTFVVSIVCFSEDVFESRLEGRSRLRTLDSLTFKNNTRVQCSKVDTWNRDFFLIIFSWVGGSRAKSTRSQETWSPSLLLHPYLGHRALSRPPGHGFYIYQLPYHPVSQDWMKICVNVLFNPRGATTDLQLVGGLAARRDGLELRPLWVLAQWEASFKEHLEWSWVYSKCSRLWCSISSNSFPRSLMTVQVLNFCMWSVLDFCKLNNFVEILFVYIEFT